MPIIDALKTGLQDPIDTDVCVIGSGPAGMTLARSLAGTRLRVLVCESGGFDPSPDVQALNLMEHAGQPVREDFMSRLRLVGGTSNVWPGRCMRLSPLDLEQRDWIDSSGWPIRPDALWAYYPQAAQILRLPALPADLDGHDLYHPSAAEADLLAEDDLVGDTALWGRSPLRFGKASTALFRGSPELTLVANLTAVEIVLDGDGHRVVAMRAVGADGRSVMLRATQFVLACGGLENARLLLASHGQHAAGVGNADDQVGRWFMDHPRAVLGRLDLQPGVHLGRLLALPLRDGHLKTGLALAPRVQREEGLANCFCELEPAYSPMSGRLYGSALEVVRRMVRKRYGHKPGTRISWTEASRYIYQLTLREVIPHRLYHLLHHLKRRARRRLMVVVHCEQPPNPSNRVYLSAERDRLGLPRLVLDWRVGSAEVCAARRLLQALDAACRRQGIGALAADEPEQDFGDASHHMGTTRMSSSPRQGVVDSDCRVHGIANLHVAGSSVFPTGGYANPTLTIVALALRLGEHLAREMAGTDPTRTQVRPPPQPTPTTSR